MTANFVATAAVVVLVVVVVVAVVGGPARRQPLRNLSMEVGRRDSLLPREEHIQPTASPRSSSSTKGSADISAKRTATKPTETALWRLAELEPADFLQRPRLGPTNKGCTAGKQAWQVCASVVGLDASII